MERLGFILLGLCVICFGLGVCGATIFRIKHRQDWEDRWLEARPLTSFFLGWLKFGVLFLGRRETPPTRIEALLRALPELVLSILLVAAGCWLVIGPVLGALPT